MSSLRVLKNVEVALRIFLSFMITNCPGEPSFLVIKRLKNYLRSSMGQMRLAMATEKKKAFRV